MQTAAPSSTSPSTTSTIGHQPPPDTLLDFHHARFTLEAAHRDFIRKAAGAHRFVLGEPSATVDEEHRP